MSVPIKKSTAPPSQTRTALIAIMVALAVILIAAAAWGGWYYYGPGWTAFTFHDGDYVSWTPVGGRPVSSLRFKGVVLSVDAPDGGAAIGTTNATRALNTMARAFATSNPPPPATLSLVRPLNAFSFPIAGLTDSANKNQNTFTAKYCSTGGPSCTDESSCAAAFPGGVLPTGIVPPPVPAPVPADQAGMNPSGATPPPNWLCYKKPIPDSWTPAAAGGTAVPPATYSSSNPGVTYPATGVCYRCAAAPVATLTGYVRTF